MKCSESNTQLRDAVSQKKLILSHITVKKLRLVGKSLLCAMFNLYCSVTISIIFVPVSKTTREEMIHETSVCSPFKNLTRLLPLGSFNERAINQNTVTCS